MIWHGVDTTQGWKDIYTNGQISWTCCLFHYMSCVAQVKCDPGTINFALSVAQLPASLNLPGFLGCLELATLNNDVISLYNFKHIYNMDTSKSVPCAR